MTSTHDPALPTRLEASLVERGVRPEPFGLVDTARSHPVPRPLRANASAAAGSRRLSIGRS